MSKKLLDSLVKSAKKPAAPKQDRPTVDVPSNVIEAFQRLVGAQAVFEVAEARMEVESELVKEEMLDIFANAIFRNGCVPANPKLETSLLDGRPDMSGIFQVQNRFKVSIPEEVSGNTDITTRVCYALEAIGMTTEAAQKLADAELDSNPVVRLRPFGELIDGHYEGEGKNKTFVEATAEEKVVGQKLLKFVTGTSADPLTEEERAIAVRIEECIKVKEGFMQRVKGYCPTVEILKGVFKIITPTHFVSHMKLGISDNPEQRQIRLKAIAAVIVGSSENSVLIRKTA